MKSKRRYKGGDDTKLLNAYLAESRPQSGNYEVYDDDDEDYDDDDEANAPNTPNFAELQEQMRKTTRTAADARLEIERKKAEEKIAQEKAEKQAAVERMRAQIAEVKRKARNARIKEENEKAARERADRERALNTEEENNSPKKQSFLGRIFSRKKRDGVSKPKFTTAVGTLRDPDKIGLGYRT